MRRLLIIATAVVAVALSAGVARAATAGDLDPSFDQDGKLVLPFKITPGQVLPTSDGKVVLTDVETATVVRLNADGSLDRSFGGGDGIVTGFADVGVGAAALQPDGKLIVASTTPLNDIVVARLDSKGSLDESFGTGGRRVYTGLPIWSADAMVVQPDGKIAIAGTSSTGMTVSRFKADGSPDGTSYAYAGPGSIKGAALTNDGKIVIAGYVATGRADSDVVVARFAPDGELDETLAGTGKVQLGAKDGDDIPAAVLAQPDGKIVVAENSGAAQKRMTVMRMTAEGALDKTFAGDGTATPEFIGATSTAGAALQPDGKILVAGTVGSEQNFVAARLDRNGAPDPGFGTDGKTAIAHEDISLAYAAGLQPDGKLVIAGLGVVQNRTAIRTVLARLLPDQPQPGDGGQPGGGGVDQSAPVLGRVTLTPARFAVARRATAVAAARRGTRIRYSLSEPAAVTLRVQRLAGGRRRTVGTLRRSGVTSANRVRFSGRIGGRALARGRYRLTVRATDAAGNRSAARTTRFRVVR